LNSIESSKKKPFSNLLTALGIPLLSSVKAQKLTSFYPNLTSFLTIIENKEWDKVGKILGIETQKALESYFYKSENIILIKELERLMRNQNSIDKVA